MVLVLQTNIPGRCDVWIVNRQRSIGHAQRRFRWHGSERLVPMIDSVLRKSHLAISSLKRIVVVRGPGPFTAVRSGIIAANTLGWTLNIPVRGLVADRVIQPADIQRLLTRRTTKKFRLVKPAYGREPNITLSAEKI